MNPNKWKLGSPYDQIEEDKNISEARIFLFFTYQYHSKNTSEKKNLPLLKTGYKYSV
jgi:hypothetical protein